MISPKILVDAIVTKLGEIPDLVTDVGGATNIFAYHDTFPEKSNLAEAIYGQKQPSVMVVWRRTRPGRRMSAWIHDVSLILKAKAETVADPDGYYAMVDHIINGVPSSGTIPLISTEIHASVDLMEVPTIDRKVLLVSADTSIDYFEITTGLPEKGGI